MYFILQFPQLKGDLLRKTGSILSYHKCQIIGNRPHQNRPDCGKLSQEYTLFRRRYTFIKPLYGKARPSRICLCQYLSRKERGKKKLGCICVTGSFNQYKSVFCCIKGNGTNKMRQEQSVWAGLFEIYIPELHFLIPSL